jgi:hypothetical protein
MSFSNSVTARGRGRNIDITALSAINLSLNSRALNEFENLILYIVINLLIQHNFIKKNSKNSFEYNIR